MIQAAARRDGTAFGVACLVSLLVLRVHPRLRPEPAPAASVAMQVTLAEPDPAPLAPPPQAEMPAVPAPAAALALPSPPTLPEIDALAPLQAAVVAHRATRGGG